MSRWLSITHSTLFIQRILCAMGQVKSYTSVSMDNVAIIGYFGEAEAHENAQKTPDNFLVTVGR
jgi:hypothetical protein